MRKLFLILLTAVATLGLNAQGSKINSAEMYVKYYKQGDGSDELEKARDAIDAAVAHDATMNVSRAWHQRGIVYTTMYEENEIKSKYPDIDMLGIAFESFQKAIEINDPKFKTPDKRILWTYMQSVSSSAYNEGVSAYETKDYATAYNRFNLVMEMNEFMEANNQQIAVESITVLDNTAYAAQAAGMHKEAAALFNKVIDNGDGDAKTYQKLSQLYDKMGEKEKSLKALEDGIAKYPDDAGLVMAELNAYFAEGKTAEAMDKIQKAIELDPQNDNLYFALALAHDGKQEYDKAEEAYKKALEINPQNFNATYNLAAMFFNQANPIIEEMNNLGISSEDQKRYEVLQKEKLELFKAAKPWFEKAKEIKPDDPGVKRALTRINSSLDD